MEGKQEVVLAVESPFFIDADIIETAPYGEIVFFKSVNNGTPEEFLCITNDGAVYTCYESKKRVMSGWPTDGMPRHHAHHSNTTITKGIIDILSFLQKTCFSRFMRHSTAAAN